MGEITEQDLVGQLNRHQIVICKTLTESEEFNLSRRCAAFLSKLRTLLNSRCEQPVWIGVGGIHRYFGIQHLPFHGAKCN